MTWYANEILAEGSAAVLQAIKRDSVLEPFAHYISEPLNYA